MVINDMFFYEMALSEPELAEWADEADQSEMTKRYIMAVVDAVIFIETAETF
jgi:hypothetical protein